MPKYSEQVNQLEMIKLINWVRMFPGEAASWIETIYNHQKSAKEGVKIWKEKGMAHKEVIDRLKRTQPMKPQLEELAVDIISHNHAKYMGLVSKVLNHNESTNSGDVYSRVKKFGKFKAVNENLAFERAGNQRHVLLMWLVDDGIGSRGHQMNILDEDMTHAGVGVFRGESGWFVVYNGVKGWQCRSACDLISMSNIQDANIAGNGYYNRTIDLKKRTDISDDDEDSDESNKPDNFNHKGSTPDYFNNDRRTNFKSDYEERKKRELDRKKYLKIPTIILKSIESSNAKQITQLESKVGKTGSKISSVDQKQYDHQEERLALMTNKIAKLRQKIKENSKEMTDMRDRKNYNEHLQNSMLRRVQKLKTEENNGQNSRSYCLKFFLNIALTLVLLLQ